MKKNVTVIFLANAFSLVSGLITSLLTAWALGPEGRGDLAVIVLYPNIVALVVGLGIPQATKYFTARNPNRTSLLFSNAICFAAGAGVIALFLAEMVIPRLIGDRSGDVMWLVRAYLINIPFALLYDVMAAMLEGSRQFRWAAISRIFFFGLQAAAYIVLWSIGELTVFNAAATMVVAQLANTSAALSCVLFVLQPAWRPNLRSFKRTVRFGLKYHLGVVTSFTTLRFDQMMLGAMATSIEMGLYVVAVRISEIMTVLASSVSEVLMPEVAASGGSKRSIERLTRSLRQTMYIYLLLLIPLMIGASFILEFAFGHTFADAAPALRILLVASMIWSAGAIVNSGLNGLGYPGLSTMSRLTSAVVTIGTLIVWLPRYSIVGAAASSLVGYSVMFAVAIFWLMRKEGLGFADILRPRRDDLPVAALVSRLRSTPRLSATRSGLGEGRAPVSQNS